MIFSRKGGGGGTPSLLKKRLYTPSPAQRGRGHVNLDYYHALKRAGRSTITCDQCQQEFAPQLTEQPYANDWVEVALICTSCAAQYPVARITPLGIRLRERMQALASRGQADTSAFREMHERYQRHVKPVSRS